MPLKGSEAKLAESLKKAMADAKSFDEAWTQFTKIVIDHFTANAVVTGNAPNGPLSDGKVT